MHAARSAASRELPREPAVGVDGVGTFTDVRRGRGDPVPSPRDRQRSRRTRQPSGPYIRVEPLRARRIGRAEVDAAKGAHWETPHPGRGPYGSKRSDESAPIVHQIARDQERRARGLGRPLDAQGHVVDLLRGALKVGPLPIPPPDRLAGLIRPLPPAPPSNACAPSSATSRNPGPQV